MQQRAFTLVELLTVVSMIGIGGGLAAFAMSEQIMDARAKSEANTVLQDLRAEHRSAREQMFGLKITSDVAGVTFQNTRGEDCTDPVGVARTQTYKAARLSVVSPVTGACFNARGEPDPPGHPTLVGGTGVIIGGPQLNTSTLTSAPTSPSALTASTDIVLAVEAKLSNPALQYFMPLRVDRAGIVDIGGKTTSVAEATTLKAGLKTNPEAALNALEKDVGEITAIDDGSQPVLSGGGGGTGSVIAPECPLDADGLPTNCTTVFNQ